MEKKITSIFNEVLGPIMYGPSSSHSAAPCRIGYLCYELLGEPVKRAKVYFDPASSYAPTYRFHQSDRGFTAGLLGIRVNEDENLNAFAIAKKRGVEIEFIIQDMPNKHPNYCLICMEGETNSLDVGNVSTGGGDFDIVDVDGCPVNITSDCWFTLVKNPVGAEAGPNRTLTKYGDNEMLVIKHFQADPGELPTGDWARSCSPAQPVPALESYNMPFVTYEEAVAYGEEHNMTLGELGLLYEQARSGKSVEEVKALMKDVYDVMWASVEDSTHRPEGSILHNFYEYKAAEMYRNKENLPDILDNIATIGIRASSVFEHTLSVGKVVAAPTGGSCGIIPAAVIGLGKDMGLSEDQIIMGMFASGLVGIFISNDATFGCEVAGCQAENGAGSAMGAAGVADMLGADAKAACDAAAIALQNLLGLICDPVGPAYVPCVTRNAAAAVNSVVSASMMMSGYKAYIPLGESIRIMMQVGLDMPACHRCTGGGLNESPSGIELNKKSDEYLNSLM